MKDLISTTYAFTPGSSGVGTVTLSGINNFDIKRLAAIINQTRGIIIYSTGSTANKYTAINGNTLTLNVDTSTHSSQDILQVIYNSIDTDSGSLGILTDLSVGLKSILNAILRPIWVNPITSRVNTDVGSVATCANVTSLTQLAGFDAKQTLLYATDRNTWSNNIRRNIT